MSSPWLRLTGTKAGGYHRNHSALDHLFVEICVPRNLLDPVRLPDFNGIQTKDTLTQPAPHSMSCRIDSRARTRIGTHFIGRPGAGRSTNPRTSLVCKSRRFQHLSQLKRHTCAACNGRMHGVDFLRRASVALRQTVVELSARLLPITCTFVTSPRVASSSRVRSAGFVRSRRWDYTPGHASFTRSI